MKATNCTHNTMTETGNKDYAWKCAECGYIYGPPEFDVRVQNHGSLFLVEAVTDEAQEWIGEHIPEDAQYFGGNLVVEHRYIDDIVTGMTEAGLIVV